jgi:hypothetical protein
MANPPCGAGLPGRRPAPHGGRLSPAGDQAALLAEPARSRSSSSATFAS